MFKIGDRVMMTNWKTAEAGTVKKLNWLPHLTGYALVEFDVSTCMTGMAVPVGWLLKV